MTTTIHSKLLQLCKKQDDLWTGISINPVTGESYSYGIIIDGHGHNSGVDDIRAILQTHLAAILESEDPQHIIQSQLEVLKQEHLAKIQSSVFADATIDRITNNLLQSGSTFICAKLYNNRIECFSIGDSEIYVLKNGDIVYHNPIHNWENEMEKQRLLARKDIHVYPKPSIRCQIMSPTTLCQKKTHTIQYTYQHTFIPSQALGHGGITEFAPERQTIYYDKSDTIKVVLGSDGLWDVFMPSHPEDFHRLLNCDAEELADVAESRWKQCWHLAKTENDINDVYDEISGFDKTMYDDVAVITLRR